jgi:hypothetical protein
MMVAGVGHPGLRVIGGRHGSGGPDGRWAISFPGGTLGKTGTNGDGRMKESKERSKGKRGWKRGEEERRRGRTVDRFQT